MKNRFQEKIKRLKKKGFTLIELIVVIAILGILVLLAAPKFLGYTADAKLTQAKADIKTLENTLTAKVTKDEDYTSSWTTVTKPELEQKNQEDKLLDKTGDLPDDYNFDGEYLQVPKKELDEIKTDLDGTFFWDNEKGKVIYEDESGNLKDENETESGDSGDLTPPGPGATTPPTTEEPELNPPKDTDGDGTSDEQEIIDGTDPTDATDPGLVYSFEIFKENGDNSVGVDNDGNLYVKGKNNTGELGVGTSSIVPAWTKVALDFKVKEVVLNFNTTFIVAENGDIYASGNKSHLGTSSNLTTFSKMSMIGTYKDHVDGVYFLNTNGDLYGYGSHQYLTGQVYGQSGPVKLETNVSDIILVSNWQSALIKKTTGEYYGIGFPYSFSYNDGTTVESASFKLATPSNLDGFTASEIKSIYRGLRQNHIYYLLNDKRLLKQVDNSYVDQNLSVEEVYSFDSYSVSNNNIIVKTTDGKFYGKGNNSNGELGLGHTNAVEDLVYIESLSKLGADKVKLNEKNTIIKKGEKYYFVGLYKGDSSLKPKTIILK